MSTEKIRFGIVGPGTVAHLHCRAIQQADGARLTAIYGRDCAKAEAFASQYGLTVYTKLDELVSSSEVDVISIATATGTHLEIGIKAAQHGKHIICEKPLEVTPQRAEKLISACAMHGVQLGIYFQARLDECTRLAKEAISSGRLGKLLFASCQMRWYRKQEYYDSALWRGTWALDGGGCLMNQGIHTLDLLIYLIGMPVEISAFQGPVTHQRIEVEDNLCAIVRFENGAVGTIEASTSCSPGFPRRVEISGENGTIVIEDNRIVRWDFTEERPEDSQIIQKFNSDTDSVGGASDPTAIDITGHCLLVEDFVSCVCNKTRPYIDGVEGKKAVEFVCAAYDSLKSGKAVLLR